MPFKNVNKLQRSALSGAVGYFHGRPPHLEMMALLIGNGARACGGDSVSKIKCI